MQLKSSLIVALLGAGLASADFSCFTTIRSTKANHIFKFTNAEVQDALSAAGVDDKPTVAGASGFPHSFGGGASDGSSGPGGGGGSNQLQFFQSDPRCNQKNPALFEYPILFQGKGVFEKLERRHGVGTPTPARIVYLADGTICGVMTHVLENPSNQNGSGNFRVCNRIKEKKRG